MVKCSANDKIHPSIGNFTSFNHLVIIFQHFLYTFVVTRSTLLMNVCPTVLTDEVIVFTNQA